MTTRIEITCRGPDQLLIYFYDAATGARTADPAVRLAIGETYAFDTHDGKRAFPFAVGHGKTPVPSGSKFYAVPPATMCT